LKDLADILKDTRSAFFTLASPKDETIIVSDVSEEEENAKNDKDIKDTLVPPPSPKLAQLQELMAQVQLLQSQKKELEQGTMGEIRTKETLKKSCLPPRWRLLMCQIIQCLGKKGFGLSGLSRVIGYSLGVMSGDDDSAIFE
nr:hypothetical protein [Tanacetum cinerariifolium]